MHWAFPDRLLYHGVVSRICDLSTLDVLTLQHYGLYAHICANAHDIHCFGLLSPACILNLLSPPATLTRTSLGCAEERKCSASMRDSMDTWHSSIFPDLKAKRHVFGCDRYLYFGATLAPPGRNLLRSLREDLRGSEAARVLGFFHHLPFPAPIAQGLKVSRPLSILQFA